MNRRTRFGTLLILALGACVPSIDRIEAPVRSAVYSYLGAEPGPRAAATVTAMTSAPLTRRSVARLALARSPRIAAALESLGIARGQAELASGLGRTSVDLGMSLSASGEVVGFHGEVLHDVLDLLLAAPRRRDGAARLEAAQARATAQILAVTARADDAFLTVAAAIETAKLARAVFDAADAGAELTERAHAAGGTTDLALAREQSVREEARLQLARAEAEVEIARAALDAALGLTGDETRWSIGETVPEIPDAPPALDDLEPVAVAASWELVALRADALGAANRARTARIGAWLPELSIGVATEYHDGSFYPGPALRFGLPLVSGERGRASAERATARHTDHLTAAVAIELRAGARATRMRALATYDQARHVRDVLIPLRRRVLDETLLQYNAMNASPYEVLIARRELAAAEREQIETRRQFAAAMAAVSALRQGAAASLAPSTSISVEAAPASSGH